MKIELELYAYRRHLRTCQFFGPGGRDTRQDKCNCPYHVDGLHRGRRYRQSLNTRSRQAADRKVSELVRKLDAEAEEAEPLRANIAETLLASLITEQGGKDIQHEEHEDIFFGPDRRAQW
jgi:hypothetical protein